MQVAQLQLRIEHVACQSRRRRISTGDKGYDILSKLSASSLHQIKHIPNRAVISLSLLGLTDAVVSVF